MENKAIKLADLPDFNKMYPNSDAKEVATYVVYASRDGVIFGDPDYTIVLDPEDFYFACLMGKVLVFSPNSLPVRVHTAYPNNGNIQNGVVAIVISVDPDDGELNHKELPLGTFENIGGELPS